MSKDGANDLSQNDQYTNRINDQKSIPDYGVEAQVKDAICQGDLNKIKSILEGPQRSVLDTLHPFYKSTLFERALNEAGQENQPEILSLLLFSGGEITTVDTSQLALDKVPTEIFQVLLDNGWDINKPSPKDRIGATALRRAIGNDELVRWMLLHGADPSIPDANDVSSLCSAASSSTPAIVSLMITHGADVRHSDAFVSAVQGQSGIPMMQYLLEQGCDINAYSHQFNPEYLDQKAGKMGSRHDRVLTPLQWAMSPPKLDRLEFLLEKGADPEAKNYAGQDAWDMARLNSWKEPMEVLMRFAKDDDFRKRDSNNLEALGKPSYVEFKAEQNSSTADV